MTAVSFLEGLPDDDLDALAALWLVRSITSGVELLRDALEHDR